MHTAGIERYRWHASVRSLCGWAAGFCAWLGCAAAAAQILAAIPEATLREPWSKHLAVVESLSQQIAGAEPSRREPLADTLSILQASLGEYETQFDRVIDRLVADANFRYAATEVSFELSQQVADIGVHLDTLYVLLGVQERKDVKDAQAALQELHRMLHAKTFFERDVLAGLTARPQTVELATRWWNAEERAIALKKRVGELRERLEGIAPSAK